jgi:formate hydrogenlyase subunit 6/NADH:ubiquinone oxidoreductase subunit I
MPFDALDRVLRPLRTGIVTSRYPKVPPVLTAAVRGLPGLDPARCDGSASCVDVCPTGAIRLSERAWSLDAGACIFCGACARSCPQGAIRLGGRVELAVRERSHLLIVTERRRDR